MTEQERFLQFLRFALDEQRVTPDSLEGIDWDRLLEFGLSQGIVGVLYYGLNRIPVSVPFRPHRKKVALWVGFYEDQKRKNIQVNRDAAAVTGFFYKKYGVKCCVLKGQANAMLYPDPFMRIPGDIDVWTDKETMEVLTIAREINPNFTLDYHHVVLTELVPTLLEVHFKPSFMGNLWHERRLDRFFREMKGKQFQQFETLPNGRKICVPTDDFNRIFQLTHIMHHFFFEGVGLRQVIDFFYLLRKGFTDEEKERTMKVVRSLHMQKFTAGLMWLLHEQLGLADEYLLTEPDDRVGRLLFKEIMKHGDAHSDGAEVKEKRGSRLLHYLYETKRNLRFAFVFPSETVWGRPVSRLYHVYYKWRLRRKLDSIPVKSPQS